MSKPKVVLAGHLPRVGVIGSSVINLTLGLQKFLSQNTLIEFNCIDIVQDEYPECDFLIVECYWHQKDLILKAKIQSKAKLLFTVREVQLPYVDYVFASNYSNFKSGEFIGFPIRKDLLTNKLKIKKSILIDHSWPDYEDTGDWKNNKDWTNNIVEWLQDYDITKMARFEKENENEIPVTDYENFISNTDHFEFFIVTHVESFPWGVLDMVYRGIKVLTPKGFIPQVLIDKLQIKEFESKEQLIALLQESELQNVQSEFIGFDELANSIVTKLLSIDKYLYIYDKDNWAIHEVGKLWLNDMYVDYLSCPQKQVLQNYDIVWFGCSNLWMMYRDFDKSKSIISIHDPIELIDVLNSDKVKDEIRQVKIVTASLEVQSLLEKSNIISTVIPTTGSLPFRDINEIKNEKLSLLTISSNQFRKNVNQIIQLFEKCQTQLNIPVEMKIGYDILQQSDYLALLDKSNVYVCMSIYEGGPIPAMEAMQRGCVVLSTAVGQMVELIENGVNGFILQPCEFFDKIKWIYENPEWLVEARKKSIQIIREKRNKDEILSKVKTLLQPT